MVKPGYCSFNEVFQGVGGWGGGFKSYLTKYYINFTQVVPLINSHFKGYVHSQCFRQSALLQESCIAIRDSPRKTKKRANLAFSFYKAVGLIQAKYFKSHPFLIQ